MEPIKFRHVYRILSLKTAISTARWRSPGHSGACDLRLKASSPLLAEADVQKVELSEEDEFLVISCNGVWDVMSSEEAVAIVRRELISSNNP